MLISPSSAFRLRLPLMLIGSVNLPPREFVVKLLRPAKALWLPKSASWLLGGFWNEKLTRSLRSVIEYIDWFIMQMFADEMDFSKGFQIVL